MEMNVKIIKYPTEKDLLWVKQCTLNTVGKKLNSKTKTVDYDWMKRLVESEHSPIRELWFGIRMEIPYWVSVH